PIAQGLLADADLVELPVGAAGVPFEGRAGRHAIVVAFTARRAGVQVPRVQVLQVDFLADSYRSDRGAAVGHDLPGATAAVAGGTPRDRYTKEVSLAAGPPGIQVVVSSPEQVLQVDRVAAQDFGPVRLA